MKGLHKKISVVALSGLMLLGGGLSQGLVANAISISPDNNQNNIGYNEFENRRIVMKYADKYGYEPEYLDNKDEQVEKKYLDGWDFLRKIEDGDLEGYRKERESIIIKVGQSRFKILFLMPKNQLDRIIMKECSKKYDFKIIHSEESSVVLGAWIRSYLNVSPKVKKQLLEEPNQFMKNRFPDAKSFRAKLSEGGIHLDRGEYYRVRVGNRDYVILKN